MTLTVHVEDEYVEREGPRAVVVDDLLEVLGVEVPPPEYWYKGWGGRDGGTGGTRGRLRERDGKGGKGTGRKKRGFGVGEA